MKTHLAILHKAYLDLILEGKKTIESRFTKVRCAPFGMVEKGDKIILKQCSGPVIGEAVAKEVKYFENLTPESVSQIANTYKNELQITDDFLKQKQDTRYITLIFLENVKRIKSYKFEKKDRRAWVVM